MEIRRADGADVGILTGCDPHISEAELKNAVRLGRVLIAEEIGAMAGWLRYNLFWDNTPFMNLLYIFESYRRHGVGRRMAEHWEKEMAEAGYKTVMTSTKSNEYAQHFYVKLGYEAVGGFRLNGDSYELIFAKKLGC